MIEVTHSVYVRVTAETPCSEEGKARLEFMTRQDIKQAGSRLGFSVFKFFFMLCFPLLVYTSDN